jgi:hypothetical protein
MATRCCWPPELGGSVIEAVAQGHALQRFRRPAVALARGDALVRRRELHVLDGAGARERLKPWKEEPICWPRTRAS